MTKTHMTMMSLLLTVCCLATPAGGSAETFSPTTLQDSTGNQADQDSTITWGSIPQKRAYKITSDNMDYDAGYLNYLHTMVDHFLDAVFIKDVPYGKHYLNQAIGIQKMWPEFKRMNESV